MTITGMLAVLRRHDVEFVVIGGVAAIAHGVRRATFDLDIVPRPEPGNYAKLSAALIDLGASTSVDSQWRDIDPSDDFDLARADNLRLQTRLGPLDILNAQLGVHAFHALGATADRATIGGVDVLVADRDRLIAMKREAGRPRDLQDIADLTAAELQDR